MDDIQSWWEVPSIAHFCSLFRVAFNLLDFDIEELEEALLTDGAEDSGSSLLQELIVRLLCGCLGNNGISTFNYQMFLRRLFRQKCREYGKENPFNSDIDFQFLPLRTKVEILHALCDFRLDAEDVMDVLKNLDSDSLRVHPLGYDENKSAYWYFYGTRLYREDYPHRAKKKKKKAREKKHGRKSRSDSESEPEMGCGEWQVVCYTESDWERLAYKMEDSQCKEERALHSVLAEDFLPEIPRLFEEKERLQKKRLMEMQPRRQSSRLEKLKHQKEEEKKALEQKDSTEKNDVKDKERSERERRDRDARRAREHRAMLRSRSHTNSECSSGSQADHPGKPRGRQTNNSLSSATGQIIIQPSRQKLRTSQVFRQSVEDLRTGLYKILDRLKNHEDAWPFLDPVEEEYAPRYYSVIAKPMDLQRMEDKLDAGEYGSFSDFRADFQLIVDNCRQYNGSENEYTEMVAKLQEAFDAAVDRYLEADISTDEEVAVEFQGEQKGRRRKSSQTSKHSPPPSHRSDDSGNDLPEEPAKEESEAEVEEEEGSQKDSESQSSHSQRSRHKVTKKSQETKRPGKKPTAIKNVTDIEALELATEQTLKDINKWLDDTPRFSEFSSASNSPSQLPIVDDCDGVGARIEHEYRARLKIRAKEKVDFTRRRFFKDHHGAIKRRREIQRTIDRLQPGKSKGNLLSNPSASKNEEASNTGGLTGMKIKDQKVENPEKSDETTPKLSLGTVLHSDVIGFGKHSFENSDSEIMKKDEDSQDDSGDEKPLLLEEDVKNSPEVEENSPEEDILSIKKSKEENSPTSNSFEKKTAPVQNSAKHEKSSTPNLSAWFKAFGAPKSQPPSKKKTEINDDSKEKLEQSKSIPKDTEEIISVDDDKDKKISVVPPLISPARRQRKASTGSSVSERSSFSQDPTDPMVDGSSPRPSLDEPYLSPQADPNKTPYHHSPLNGTIRVGFYQDTCFPRGSSDKSSSPREPPTPNCSPREPPSCSPRDIPSCSPRTPMASPKSDYPLYSASSLPYQSPSVHSYDAPLSPYPAHMSYYDTNKSLTDQYRSTQTATEKSISSTYPVKKRIINEVEQSTRSSPDVSSYRGGSFTPTRNAIENDRSFTPTPGRIPTQPNTRPAYAPETALALGLHGISPHLMDPYAEERLLSATYYGNDGIYGKHTPSTTSIHSMYPTSSSVMSNAGYPRDDRGYPRIPPNFSESRTIKVSDSPTSYSSSIPVSKTTTPVINYSGRSAELSLNTTRSSSPLNYSSHPSTTSKTITPPNISYVNRSQDSNKITECPLDFAKVSQNDTTKSKEMSHVSYPTSRESLPPKVSSPYSRTVSDLSAASLSYNHSPDIVSGKLSVPPSPLSYPSQQDLLAGKVNYSHPMSDLARFGYPHSVSYNHPMSDLIQAKATSGTYSSRPVDLMTGGYNRPLGELMPGREVAYQPVSRASSTPKPSEPVSKPPVKKPSKKRKSSDTSTPPGIPPGFQQYLGQSSSEAIALKTSSVVPGSAFNFGPAPLKDSYASYLEEMRSGNFFAPHPEISANTKSSSPSPHPPTSPFPYLSHAPSRPLSYPHPFMNYPQILQKDELLRPTMVLHQGLLPPTGYPPPGGYLGMHDPINRSSWL